MTPLRTRAIDAAMAYTVVAPSAVHAVVDALLAANLLHDPDLSVTGDGSGTALPLIRDPRDDEARIARALVAVWRVRLLPASALNGQSRSEAIARAVLDVADQEDD